MKTGHLAWVTASRRAAEDARAAADQAIVDAYVAGHSLGELAAAMGVASQNAPRMILRKHRVVIRPAGRPRSANYQPDQTQEAT